MRRRHEAGFRRRWAAALSITALLLADAEPALAYLKFGVPLDGRTVTISWDRAPVRYRVFEQGVSGVTAPAFRDAVARAFATWEAVPSATIEYRFEGFTSTARPGDEDFVNTLGFDDRPELDRVLASTTLLIDELTGELVESDIFFNSAFAWSVAANGEPSRFDLETIALHEIGHFSGLGHSALGETELTGTGRRVTAVEAVMFPIAFGPGNISNRRLRADDVAGISDLYPTDAFNEETGSVSGRVTLGGQGVYGAHVTAFNPRTGLTVGNFTLNGQGQFSIAGLTPGAHVIRVEPLDDAEVASFLDEDATVEIDFRATFHRRLVVVPHGGDSGNVAIPVASK